LIDRRVKLKLAAETWDSTGHLDTNISGRLILCTNRSDFGY